MPSIALISVGVRRAPSRRCRCRRRWNRSPRTRAQRMERRAGSEISCVEYISRYFGKATGHLSWDESLQSRTSTSTLSGDDCNRIRGLGLRRQLVARRGDVRAVPRRSRLGQRDVARVLLRLQAGRCSRAGRTAARGRTPPAAPASPPRQRLRPRRRLAARHRPQPAAPAAERRRADPRRRRAPSPPTWSAASRCPRRPASATSRPSCSRSTARSSTATAAAAARARSASPTSSATPSCAPSPTRCRT